jgi:6,7-dimethyl-8-ribityllumazine synthase
MTSKKTNLSAHHLTAVKAAHQFRIGILVSEWNPEVTGALRDAAFETLVHYGVNPKNIFIHDVPGSFELPMAAQFLCKSKTVDAVICLGCVIQGETPHFEYICQSVSQGITTVGLDYNMPVIFGVLTTLNLQQALDRAGGKHGNKGTEAAVAALKMIELKASIKKDKTGDKH